MSVSNIWNAHVCNYFLAYYIMYWLCNVIEIVTCLFINSWKNCWWNSISDTKYYENRLSLKLCLKCVVNTKWKIDLEFGSVRNLPPKNVDKSAGVKYYICWAWLEGLFSLPAVCLFRNSYISRCGTDSAGTASGVLSVSWFYSILITMVLVIFKLKLTLCVNRNMTNNINRS